MSGKNVDIDKIIGAMTLEEKLLLCTGDGSWHTREFPHHGIPSILMSDGTNGVRIQRQQHDVGGHDLAYATLNNSFDSAEALANTYESTSFPSGSTIACSWDPRLLSEVAHAIAIECRALGINLLLGPGINIRRHPLTARNFEYYSEDPLLTGVLGTAMVTGLREHGVGATIKHFACHNSDTYRTRVDSIADERTLHEVYLAAFEYIVKQGNPAAVMSSYNKINGVHSSGNKWLLKTILRDSWGFSGIVVSDWGGVPDPFGEAGAGLDLQMPESQAMRSVLKEAVLDGRLDESQIDTRVANILSVVFALKEIQQTAVPVDVVEAHETARRAAAESIVLLRNEKKILPLRKDLRIALIGELAEEPLFQGTGCAIVNPRMMDQPLQCIRSRTDEFTYAKGYSHSDSNDPRTLLKKARSVAETADVAIVFVGSDLPRESDSYNRKAMNIEHTHEAVLKSVLGTGTPTIVVIQSGDIVEMPWIESVEAVLMAGFGGEGVGEAIARVLFGEVNPGAKLPVTIPRSLKDTPAYTTFPGDGFNMVMGEGVFVGYKYYEYKGIEPLFPFGFGLSYTTFDITGLTLIDRVVEMPQSVRFEVTIQNTGTLPGQEVVQVYVAPPKGKVARPVRELRAFEKVMLAPRASTTLSFELQYRDFAYYDTSRKDWIVEDGEYSIEVGTSSRDIALRSMVEISEGISSPIILHPGSGFTEIFDSPISGRILMEFLVSHQLIKPEDATDEFEEALKHTFWGIYSYLDMNTNGKITYQMVKELVESMNLALAASKEEQH